MRRTDSRTFLTLLADSFRGSKSHHWTLELTPLDSRGIVLYLIRYCHENRTTFRITADNQLPRNFTQARVDDLMEWVLEHIGELRCLESNVVLRFLSGRHMDMLSFDQVHPHLASDAIGQEWCMSCNAWNLYIISNIG